MMLKGKNPVILLFFSILTLISLPTIYSKVKKELKKSKEKEKAVKDIFMYEQFLNPPNIDN